MGISGGLKHGTDLVLREAWVSHILWTDMGADRCQTGRDRF